MDYNIDTKFDSVIEFICRRWMNVAPNFADFWTNGNCYWFAHILTARFQYLKIYYNPIEGHFVAGDGDKFYDINGYYTSNDLILLEEIEKTDDAHFRRLIRDCVL